ncbi:MAG TPA: hypothetical protein VN193_14855 [Candidatus Angelobacter sp.]|nr:hypothetical protein [Candidatus Angelobacter sp.]
MHPSRPTLRTGALVAAAATAAAAALAVAPLAVHAAPQLPTCEGGSLTVAATIPNVLQGAETASFPVTVTPQGGGAATQATLDFAAAQTSRSTTLNSLPFGTYAVHEAAPTGWTAQPDQTVTLGSAQCSQSASFANAIVPAAATFQVATIPGGGEPGWTFTLVGPGTPSGGEHLTSLGTAPVAFATPLAEGLYTVAQTTRTGWDQTAATGCVFSVDYPADAGRTFACSVTDTHEGRVTVTATHGGHPPSGSDALHFVVSGGPDNVLLTQVANAADQGALDFGLLRPGGYLLCQQAPATGWATSLVAQGGIPNTSGDICLPFTLAPGEARAFTIDTTSPAAPTSTPTPTATPTPAPVVSLPRTGGVQGTSDTIAIPNTGAGLSAAVGGLLLLGGAGLLAWGRRRSRRTR